MSSVKIFDNLYYGIYPGVVFPSFHVDHFVGLTEKEELDPFDPQGASIKIFPIKDRKAVSVEKLAEIVEYINGLDGVVYIFCKGGHGRSGMVAAAVYGKREGKNGSESIEHINALWKKQRDMKKLRPVIRKLGSPQTIEQKRVVIQYLFDASRQIDYVWFYETDDGYGVMNNLYIPKKPVIINGEEWMTTEHYFHAMKFRGPRASARSIEYSNLIKIADSPSKSKNLGNQKPNLFRGANWKLNKKLDHRLMNDVIAEYKDVKMRSDWNKASVAVMLNALLHKFTQDEELLDLLLTIPDNVYFVEHTVRDKIWADGGDGGTGEKGQNRLGKLITAMSYVLKHGNCKGMNPVIKDRIRIKTIILYQSE